MTLKTLKDLKCSSCMKGCDNNLCDCLGTEEYHDVDVIKLRQEALKWIKEESWFSNNDSWFSNNDLFNSIDPFLPQVRAIKRFIKHFFNITDKEMKDGLD